MEIALVMKLNEKADDLLRRYIREFVKGNTLLIAQADIHCVADAGDSARDEDMSVLRLVGCPEHVHGE